MGNLVKFFVLVVLTCSCVIFIWSDLIVLPNSIVKASENLSKTCTKDLTQAIPPTTEIVIGAVFCRNASTTKIKSKYSEYTITMLKSVVLSAKFHNISTVKIHLFLENVKEDEPYIREKFLDDNLFNSNSFPVNVTLQVHSAVDAVPKEYRDKLVNVNRFRCCFVRLFFPSALPDVDSIIHLDSDMVVTGNIGKHWQELHKMNPVQFIGVGHNRQPQNDKFQLLDKATMGAFPHMPPKGANGGLLIMNLTRMREFGWEEKILRLYDIYSTQLKEVLDQTVVNILLFYNPAIYQAMPCSLHFLFDACEKGWFCPEATNDPEGIHLVHGAGFRFETDTFQEIYKTFYKFNVSAPSANFHEDVVNPIRNFYANHTTKNECFPSLSKHLFKQYK